MENNLNNQIKELTSAHTNNKMQISAFKLMDDPQLPIYGINISKVKSFEMTSDIKITKVLGNEKYLMGIGSVRNDTISIINLARWLGIDYLSENPNDYKYTVLCEFNETKIAFVCNKIIRIYNKSAEELQTIEEIGDNEKITYITKIDTKDENITSHSNEDDTELCFVLDVERMLHDLFPKKDIGKLEDIKIFEDFPISQKLILVAEDSKAARNSLEALFKDIKANYMFFYNGEEIINWLSNNKNKSSDIGVIITDLEMPIKDGYRVIDYIKKEELYKNIPLYAHSSMSNVGAVEKTKQLGVNDFIPKFNPKIILDVIQKHLGVEK